MPSPQPQHTRAALVAAAEDVAARLGDTRLSVGRFCAETGLTPPGRPPEIAADCMLADLHAAVLAAGGFDTQRRLLRRVAWSNASLVRRFGNWGGALRALRDWTRAHVPDPMPPRSMPASPSRPGGGPMAVRWAAEQAGLIKKFLLPRA